LAQKHDHPEIELILSSVLKSLASLSKSNLVIKHFKFNRKECKRKKREYNIYLTSPTCYYSLLCLFNDTFSFSGYISSNGMIITKEKIGKDVEGIRAEAYFKKVSLHETGSGGWAREY
jgi:hypothetical protein